MIQVGKYHISSYNFTVAVLLVCSFPTPDLFTEGWGIGVLLGLFFPFFIRFIKFQVDIENPVFWHVIIVGIPIFFVILDFFVVKSWWETRQGFVTGSLVSLIVILIMDNVYSEEEDEDSIKNNV